MVDETQGFDLDSIDDDSLAARLKKLPGFKDLFFDPSEPAQDPPKPRKGGGQTVKPQEMEGAMSSLVTALTKGIEMGAAMGAATSTKPVPKKGPVVKHHGFFGDYIVGAPSEGDDERD